MNLNIDLNKLKRDALAHLKNFFARGPREDLEKRFQVLARVGQGSMSKLFRARDLKTGRTVALKVLDKAKTARLMARNYYGAVRPPEGEISVVLKHPNIVLTYEHGMSTKNDHFLVMEFIEGLGLNFLVETKSPALNGKRLNYLTQAADGLEYFHRQNFIHRDINPRNMMINNEGVLKLIDFGLAVPNTEQFRRPGNRTGSINYMAPELIRRNPTDERIDIFSFGVTVYEVMLGKFPWEATDTTERAKQHINVLPTSPKKVDPNIEDDLCEVLLRGIAQNPKNRFQTMKDFAIALRGLKRQDY